MGTTTHTSCSNPQKKLVLACSREGGGGHVYSYDPTLANELAWIDGIFAVQPWAVAGCCQLVSNIIANILREGAAGHTGLGRHFSHRATFN